MRRSYGAVMSSGRAERVSNPRSLPQLIPQMRVGQREPVGQLVVGARAAVAALDVLVVPDLVAELDQASGELARVPRMDTVVTGRSEEEDRWILGVRI